MDSFLQIINNLPQPHYCERVSNHLFAEPINLVSNLAFLVSAVLAYKLLKKIKIKNSIYNFLPWLILLIGLGSSLWHFYGTPIALPLDAIPVYIFLGLSLFLLLKNLTKSTSLTVTIIGLFILLQAFLTINFPYFLNGSIHHVTSAVLLSILIIWIYKKFGKVAFQLFFVFLVYVAAIIFRTIDIQICPIFPIGTHFLWHIFVAIGAYYIVKFLAVPLKNKN